MSLLRFLGLGESRRPEGRPARPGSGDTDTVRRISEQLERLDPATAKYLASFAYVLARVANADLEIDSSETEEIERAIGSLAHLSDAEAALVVEIAKSQARLLGGTENYVVTREFRRISTREQRTELLECIYAVAAADGTISGVETAEIRAIAEELGFTRAEANAFRSRYRDKLAELRSG